MNKKIFTGILCILLMFNLASCTNKNETENEYVQNKIIGAYLPGVTQEMNTASYWVEQQNKADEVIVSDEGISAINNNVAQINTTKDVLKAKDTMTGDELKEILSAIEMPNYQYVNGELINKKYSDNLIAAMQIPYVPEEVNGVYGILAQDAVLKVLPTSDILMNDSTDTEHNYFNVAPLKLGEGVIIYHQTNLKAFSFILSSYGYGWIETEKIATTSKKEFKAYLTSKDFIVAIEDNINLNNTSSNANLSSIAISMGTKLPIVPVTDDAVADAQKPVGSYIASLPTINDKGNLKLLPVVIPFNDKFSYKYLSFTKENILNMSTRLIGNKYGNNGFLGNRDNLNTVKDIYSCFGINLPNDISQYKDIKNHLLDVTELKPNARIKELSRLNPGTILVSDEHIAIYLGMVNKIPYIVHAIDVVFDKEQNKISVQSNVVSSIEINYSQQETFLDTVKYFIDISNSVVNNKIK